MTAATLRTNRVSVAWSSMLAARSARLVKIAHNVFLGVVTQSLAEILVLVEKGGVSRSAFLEFLKQRSIEAMAGQTIDLGDPSDARDDDDDDLDDDAKSS